MSIRLQLLAIALTTLVLPWAGCQYARELESTLRFAQENFLQAAAQTIAHALSSQPERVFNTVDGQQPFDANQGDLYVFRLHGEPLLDGYREDWGVDVGPRTMRSGGIAARVQAGATAHYLLLYLEVDDPEFDPEPRDVNPKQDSFDRVNLALQRPDGSVDSIFLATSAPGPIQAQQIEGEGDAEERVTVEPRIQAFWLQTSHGYHLEARVPRAMVGSRLWIQAVDGRHGTTAGVVPTDSCAGGRLIIPTPGLDELLATFIAPGMQASVIDANALRLGSAGAVTFGDDEREAAKGTWYRRLVAEDTGHWPLRESAPDHLGGRSVAAALAGSPQAEWQRADSHGLPLLAAAAPILVDQQIRGAVVVEQAGDQLIDLRNTALVHLFNRILLATALAVAAAFGVATWIIVRIASLRQAADSAITNDGRIRLDMPESQRSDEIGDLSRAFQRLLERLNEHSQYLRTLGGKLSHELRTPLTIVRSSLDNLESEGLRSDQQGYAHRAREGASRLLSILNALGAASRVEESILQAERVSFDLRSLMQSAVDGYRVGFPMTGVELFIPQDICLMHGAPDLVVQMLDKLIDNAVDFCAPSGAITVRLTRLAGRYEVSVDNDGSPIPEHMLNRLFESLFEHRQGGDGKPHFGLGLYIVRLIAEFHNGQVVAANRPGGGGVVFVVSLPMI